MLHIFGLTVETSRYAKNHPVGLVIVSSFTLVN